MPYFIVWWVRVGRLRKMWDWICGGRGKLIPSVKALHLCLSLLSHCLFLKKIVHYLMFHLFIWNFISIWQKCLPISTHGCKNELKNELSLWLFDFSECMYIQYVHQTVFVDPLPWRLDLHPSSLVPDTSTRMYSNTHTHSRWVITHRGGTLDKHLYFWVISRQSASNGWSCWCPKDF